MKKVLLSLSLLAATLFANAQQFTLWNAQYGVTNFPGTPTPSAFNNGVPSDKTVMPVKNPAVDGGLYVDTLGITSGTTAGTGAYRNVIQATGSSGATSSASPTWYYIGGFGIGSFSAPNVGAPWARPSQNSNFGAVLSNFSTAKLYFYANYTGNAPQLQVQLVSTLYVDSTYAYNFQLDAGTNAANTWNLYSAPLSAFNAVAADYSLHGPALTQAIADSIFKFAFSVTPGTGAGGPNSSGAAWFQIGNIWIGSSATFLATTPQAASNISSAVLFPNPISNGGQVSANISLANQSTVTTIVTDMMGKQITSLTAPTSVGNSVSTLPVFNTAGLAKGMYTVTYVIDGTPAKTELVAVQ